MNLELIYDEMNLNILKHFIFYIPTNEITKKLYDSESLIKMDKKIFYLNSDFNIIDYPDTNPLDFLNKPKLLKSNYFKILELKNEINNDAFVLFYKTYLKQLNAFTEIADLVNKNIQKDIPNCIKEVSEYVNYNFFILNEHLTSIKEIEPSLNQIIIQNEKLDIGVLDKLPNQLKNSFIPNTPIIGTMPFKDFIRRGNKDKIVQIIETNFSDLRGISLRYLIQYLEDQGVLILNHGDYQKLYDSIKELFGGKDIAKYNSVFSIANFTSNDTKYKIKKIAFEKAFEKAFEEIQ
jgi:hypothetical protein